MMTFDAYRDSLSGAAPPADVGPPLQALWWAAKGEWDHAHKVCQQHEDSDDVNWVHAYLHRQEGDLRNARGWYDRAGKTMPAGELDEEWRGLASEFLNRSESCAGGAPLQWRVFSCSSDRGPPGPHHDS